MEIIQILHTNWQEIVWNERRIDVDKYLKINKSFFPPRFEKNSRKINAIIRMEIKTRHYSLISFSRLGAYDIFC